MSSGISVLAIIGGIFLILMGLHSLIKGKLPFAKAPVEAKDVVLFAQIQGICLALSGVLLICFIIFQFGIYKFLFGIIGLDVITVLGKGFSRKK